MWPERYATNVDILWQFYDFLRIAAKQMFYTKTEESVNFVYLYVTSDAESDVDQIVLFIAQASFGRLL